MKNPGIYILTSPSGKKYVGKDSNLPTRVRDHLSGNTPQCRHVHRAIQKYGREAFSVEIIRYPGISEDALNAVERWKIRQLQTLSPSGYNLTEGGEGVIPSEEIRRKKSAIVSKQIANGTHNFVGENHPAKQHVKKGTHHFLGDKNPVHKQLADGKHHFLDSNFQRQVQKKRIDKGTHNFLGSDFQQYHAKKRIDEGTHNFLGENHPIKRLSKEGRHPSTRKRLKGEWCYIIALSRFWYEIHDYTLKRRAEFLSKDIPDTSNAEQTYLF
ncbi:hypothetical protein C6503_19125 [Candidatus Poribacteria bacterium]|nr:MAG: hypothetical protein C6503_19125 [Candidatus Poribacteria bacterium]